MLNKLKLRKDQVVSLISLAVFLLLIGSLGGASGASGVGGVGGAGGGGGGGVGGVPATEQLKLAISNKTLPVRSVEVEDIPIFTGEVYADQLMEPPVAEDVSRLAIDLQTATDLLANTLSASSAVVIDQKSGSILLDKNSREKFLPASTTKLMTALIVREIYKLDEVVRIEEIPPNPDVKIYFRPGTELTVNNLLQAMLIQSNNEAALAFALHHPEGEKGFVKAMNDKAVSLNLKNTHFQNPVGLDADDQYSTAFDLSLLGREVMKDEVIRAIVRQPRSLVTDLTGSSALYVSTTNSLLYRDPTITGIKTGTTGGAGEVLISQVDRFGHPIMIVVMGSIDRESDTLKIIDWIYQNYRWQKYDEAG